MSLLRPMFFAALALVSPVQIAVATETAVKPEINPPGDIPDSQVFVTYNSPAGYGLKVPEGWSRETVANTVTFKDKYNTITITLRDEPHASVEQIKRDFLPRIEAGPRAPKLGKVRIAKIGGALTVQAEYTVNSEPNSVTGKQIRLEGERTFYPAGDRVLELDLTAPQGADNVDQWQLIARSVHLK